MKTIARAAAVLSFIFCLLAGVWILSRTNFKGDNDVLGTAIGFYFVGKAFFVGPMLWLAGEKCCPNLEGK
jgi:di/tricarboxylate transporter